MKTLIIYSLLTLNCYILLGQEYPDWAIEYFNNQLVEFNASKAKQDLKEKKVTLFVLLSSFNTVDVFLTNEQLNTIYKRFGFSYEYKYLEIPQEFLTPKQEEYNNVVYKYLDSINKNDVKEAIEIETNRFMIENKLISQRTDKQLEKIVKKEFKKKDRQLRSELLQAEKYYRNREFKKALEIYLKIENEVKTENAKRFIYNSKYHSLMNLEKFNEAYRLIELDNNTWINKLIKK